MNELVVSRLEELETVIERGVVDVGVALLEIRDNRLYRENHSTFNDYCRKRWGWSRDYGDRLIAATKITKLISTDNCQQPVNEAQARELVPLLREDEEQVAEVWEEIKEEHGEDITAEVVRQHVSKRLGREPLKHKHTAPSREGVDLFEVFKCPGCGYEGERPEFRLKGVTA